MILPEKLTLNCMLFHHVHGSIPKLWRKNSLLLEQNVNRRTIMRTASDNRTYENHF